MHDDQTNIRQIDFARVPQADGQDFMTLVEQAQRTFPARFADKIGHDKHQRALLDRVQTTQQQAASDSVKGARGQSWLFEQIVDQPQHVDAPASRRNRSVNPAAVEYRADTVAMPGQQPGESGHKSIKTLSFQGLQHRQNQSTG